MTATVVNTKIREVENKIPNTSSLVTATVLNTKISKVENETLIHDIYITTPEFEKLTAKLFTARLKLVDLVWKTNYFDKQVTSFNKRIISNKTKYLEVQKKLNSVIKDCNFFLGRNYFTTNNGSQNTFIYQPALDTWELKKRQRLWLFS